MALAERNILNQTELAKRRAKQPTVGIPKTTSSTAPRNMLSKFPLYKLLSLALIPLIIFPEIALANSTTAGVQPFGIPFEFILFALTLLGVAVFQGLPLQVALIGLLSIIWYKLAFTGFAQGTEILNGAPGLLHHLQQEWVTLVNLLGLLTGAVLLANHFEQSHIAKRIPPLLPAGWLGGFALLVIIFVISAFLDNIAAALIGGTIALSIFAGRVHLSYIIAIVAASNAGGSGSVIGDTTTTMIWISGVSPLAVLHAYVPALIAVVIFGVPAAIMQNRYSTIVHENGSTTALVDMPRLIIVVLMLATVLLTNLVLNTFFKSYANSFPFLGVAMWLVLLCTRNWRRPDWHLLPASLVGAAFLLCLVLCASMMPIKALPPASAFSSFTLGVISAVFDNIPLTELAIKQGGYDWGILSFAVGFGGSMMWFGSSAGVALCGLFPQGKSVTAWVRHGYPVILAYLCAFLIAIMTIGWQPHLGSII